MAEPIITLVVAVAQNGVIGVDGDLPWKLSTDLKRFKATTIGKPIIMGRKTFDSIGRALPERLNIVISRSKKAYPDTIWVTSLAEAVEVARDWADENAADEICVIGGGQIYAEALPLASRLYVTHVMASPEGDTKFPSISDAEWLPVSSERVESGEKDTAETLFVVYERASGQ